MIVAVWYCACWYSCWSCCGVVGPVILLISWRLLIVMYVGVVVML